MHLTSLKSYIYGMSCHYYLVLSSDYVGKKIKPFYQNHISCYLSTKNSYIFFPLTSFFDHEFVQTHSATSQRLWVQLLVHFRATLQDRCGFFKTTLQRQSCEEIRIFLLCTLKIASENHLKPPTNEKLVFSMKVIGE